MSKAEEAALERSDSNDELGMTKIDREELVGEQTTVREWLWRLLYDLKHWIMRCYFRMVLYMFYREVDVIGLENVPLDVPVIFCGNHQNQFVDGLMLYSMTPRPVGFITAAKSTKRFLVGHFARFLDAIPVRRPQDEATPGTGFISGIEGERVTGSGTAFTAEIKAGDLLSLRNPTLPHNTKAEPLVIKVDTIESDTSLTIKPIRLPEGMGNFTGFRGEDTPFKILPKIDHNSMFEAVYHTLIEQKGCIGIFPEGGSHDQTSLLPMKDGVARFALGAAARGADPLIIPVGLTYYYGHRFRSRAHVEYGPPIRISEAIREMYKSDPQGATSTLMKQVEQGLLGVTINAPDWQTLKYIHHMRRLYQPSRIKLDVAELLDLTRRFAEGFKYLQSQEDSDLKELCNKLDLYQELLKNYLLTDAQVESLHTLGTRTSYALLLKRMLSTARWFVLCIPGCIISLPVGVCSRVYSIVKSEEALKASTVKLRGNDVKASYKIISAMVVAPLMLLAIGIFMWVVHGFLIAIASMLTLPFLAYYSVVWFNRAMVGARATFPLLLSLHSDRYFNRFSELYKFRKELSKNVIWLVEHRLRQPGRWNATSEQLLLRIKETNKIAPPPNEPFNPEHNSRLTRGRHLPQLDMT